MEGTTPTFLCCRHMGKSAGEEVPSLSPPHCSPLPPATRRKWQICSVKVLTFIKPHFPNGQGLCRAKLAQCIHFIWEQAPILPPCGWGHEAILVLRAASEGIWVGCSYPTLFLDTLGEQIPRFGCGGSRRTHLTPAMFLCIQNPWALLSFLCVSPHWWRGRWILEPKALTSVSNPNDIFKKLEVVLMLTFSIVFLVQNSPFLWLHPFFWTIFEENVKLPIYYWFQVTETRLRSLKDRRSSLF